MNILFVIYIGFLILLIIVVFYLNYTSQTSDLKTLYFKLLDHDPRITSYSLGSDENNKYKNVYVQIKSEKPPEKPEETDAAKKANTSNDNEKSQNNPIEGNDDNVIMKYENYPVDFYSKMITSIPEAQIHGKIFNQSNGYKLTGVTFYDSSVTTRSAYNETSSESMPCPNHYEGPNCEIKKFCSETDYLYNSGHKFLTYTQFNSLNLYNTGSYEDDKDKSITEVANYEQEPTHPKLRIKCLNAKGDYQLEVCNKNKKLNAEIKCVNYDICEDRLSGYKHNYTLPGKDPLPENEYYLCENNKSVLHKCDTDLVFEPIANGCVQKSTSILLNMIHSTKKVCDGDDDTKNNEGSGTDKSNTRSYNYSDHMYNFDYGQTIYKKNTEDNTKNDTQTKICDISRESGTDVLYTYKWGDEFNLEIDKPPNEIFDKVKQTCIKTKDLNIFDLFHENASIPFAWSNAMALKHSFNIKTQQYNCNTETSKFKWDYINNKIIINNKQTVSEDELKIATNILDEYTKHQYIIDSASPCQNQILQTDQMPWQGMNYSSYPKDKVPILYNVKFKNIIEHDDLPNRNYIPTWPVYDLQTNTFRGSSCKFVDTTLQITVYIDIMPPIGFNYYVQDRDDYVADGTATNEKINNNANETNDNNTTTGDDKVKKSKETQKTNIDNDTDSVGNKFLTLQGYNKFFYEEKINNLHDFLWYGIATGKTETFTFSNKAITQIFTHKCFTTEINLRKFIETNKLPFKTYILWHKIHDDTYQLKITENFIVTKYCIFQPLTGQKEPSAYIPLIIEKTNNSIQISYGNCNYLLSKDKEINKVIFTLPS